MISSVWHTADAHSAPQSLIETPKMLKMPFAANVICLHCILKEWWENVNGFCCKLYTPISTERILKIG